MKTYNFDGGAHLASQNQNICVRRERNICQICWSTTVATGDFQTSTGAVSKVMIAQGCCSYKTAFDLTNVGYDCAKIPQAFKDKAAETDVMAAYGFCGGQLGDENDVATRATVCSRSVPFHIRFLSDLYETNDEMGATPNGFRLAYILKGC